MKQLLFALMAVGIISSTSAQKNIVRNSDKVDLDWGEEFQDKASTTLTDIVAVDDEGFYATKVKRPLTALGSSKIFLASYNSDLSQTNSLELELKEGTKDKNFEGIHQLDDKLFLFSSFENKEAEKNYLFVQTINKKSLIPNDDIRKIAEIDLSDAKRSRSGSFSVIISDDDSKVLVYFDTPYDKNSNEKYGVHVFDTEFNELWKKEIELPYSDDLFLREQIEISDKGDVFIMGSLFKEKKERDRKEVNYKYLLMEYSDNGEKSHEYEIDLDGKFVKSLAMIVTENNDILCGGFYANKVKQGISGSFFLRIDRNSKSIAKKATSEFTLDFITQDLSDRAKKKAEKKADKGEDPELYRYDIDELILREDGGIVILGEQYYIDVRTVQTQNGTRTTYIYNYLDIIAVNISPEGNIDWAVKVPKRQVTSNDGGHFSSYVSAVKDDKIYIIYNGNIQNIANPKEGKLKNMSLKEPLMVLAEIDGNGNLSKEPLLGGQRKGIIMRPKVCEQVNEKELILYGERRKDKGFVKVTLN